MLAIHRAAVRGTAASRDTAEVVADWAPLPVRPEDVEDLAQRIRDGAERAIVARVQGGRIVGFGAIVPEARELRAVYVAPDHGRRGLGGRILRELEAMAGRLGAAEPGLDASLNAEAFYRRHGYAVFARGEHVLRSGRAMACIRMFKVLEPPAPDRIPF